MATSLEVIRQITIRAQTEGVLGTTEALQKLADAQENVAVTSDKSSKSTLSAQSALDRQQRSLDTNFRATQQYTKTVSDLDRAHAQGLTSQARHNELMALAVTRYNAAGAAAA